ncbi:MAG: FtsX-like permease family protein [Eubacteriales bacterium]|nr:FtsX-like permease family protein [Eubacteriales bacterium]
MKSYLSLISISAKMHRRQNRMTILCIVFAVFLVTAVFSMAEMGIRMETTRIVDKHGVDSLLAMAASASAQNYFFIAAVLFVMILLAGILMISSSIGSNVAQRTRFFGMMRCIGMSKKQIVRFVRLEALNWCKTAVPAGVALGIVSAWLLCAVLRFLVGEEFSTIPLFGVSFIGILCGIMVGIVTVLLAAGAPARRAAKVSPIAAVSGNSDASPAASHAINARLCKIETALGIHHAVERKKNLFLMVGSFALSIVLLFAFVAMVDLVNCMMPQSSAAADITLSATDAEGFIDSTLPKTLEGMAGVTHAFGRNSALDFPAGVQKEDFQTDRVDLITFDAFDLQCLAKDKMLQKGSNLSAVLVNPDAVLLIADTDSPLTIGDSLQAVGHSLLVAGRLKYNLFSADGSSDGTVTLITSHETFTALTGITGYSLVYLQTAPDITDAQVEAIRQTVGDTAAFEDQRGQSTSNTYLAFVVCLYTFLGVIALITILNIANNISMSVTVRTKLYGAMRATGMSVRQVIKMIVVETLTYTVLGCVAGCAIGLAVSRMLYASVIKPHFPYMVWRVPVLPLMLILLFALLATAAALYGPAKRMRKMSITETISEL